MGLCDEIDQGCNDVVEATDLVTFAPLDGPPEDVLARLAGGAPIIVENGTVRACWGAYALPANVRLADHRVTGSLSGGVVSDNAGDGIAIVRTTTAPALPFVEIINGDFGDGSTENAPGDVIVGSGLADVVGAVDLVYTAIDCS